MHPMIQYWKDVFGEYSSPIDGGLVFHNSVFPDPLMSPQFVTTDLETFLDKHPSPSHFNCIGSPLELLPIAHRHGYRCLKNFALGTTDITQIPKNYNYPVETMGLDAAHCLPHFKDLLKDGFPKDYPFLKNLLAYLPKSNAQYSTLFMKKNETPVAMVTAGVSNSIGLVINAVVDSSQRGQGLSHHLVNAVIQHMKNNGVEKGYFWTELEGISQHGEQLDNYMIFTR